MSTVEEQIRQEARIRKAELFTTVLAEVGVTSDFVLDMPDAVWSLATAVVSDRFRGGKPVGVPSSATRALVRSMLRQREQRRSVYAVPPEPQPANPLQGLPGA